MDSLIVNCGGFRTVVELDVYTDGRPCYVASHPDLGASIIGYGDTAQDAVDRLTAVRTFLIQRALSTEEYC